MSPSKKERLEIKIATYEAEISELEAVIANLQGIVNKKAGKIKYIKNCIKKIDAESKA